MRVWFESLGFTKRMFLSSASKNPWLSLLRVCPKEVRLGLPFCPNQSKHSRRFIHSGPPGHFLPWAGYCTEKLQNTLPCCVARWLREPDLEMTEVPVYNRVMTFLSEMWTWDGGHGHSLQYSCLENPMDRGGWWTVVHRVTKSWTQLKSLSTHMFNLINTLSTRLTIPILCTY